MKFSHFDTIIPALFRGSQIPSYDRKRISTKDGDFLDLDILRANSKVVNIISHGLESSSRSDYIQNMANAFFEAGTDVVAWNNRSCSGEMNRKVRFYHSGEVSDLREVVKYCVEVLGFEKINLIGTSMGGNQTLCFLAKEKELCLSYIQKSIVFSVPMSLADSSILLNKGMGRLYGYNFLKSLKPKVIIKRNILKEKGIDIDDLKFVKTLEDFDHYFTAPISGFNSGKDYYEKCSSLQLLNEITKPVLIVNARNDPFLSKNCYPSKLDNEFVKTYYPKRGGHIGFWNPLKNKTMEQIALNYLL